MAPPAVSDPGRNPAEDDQRVELALAMLLRAGVLVAGALVLIGGSVHLLTTGGQHPDYHRFTGESGAYRNPLSVLGAALHFDPLGLIQLGVLILLATPVLRVAFSLIAFAREGDRTYVRMTALVLLILLLSLTGVLP